MPEETKGIIIPRRLGLLRALTAIAEGKGRELFARLKVEYGDEIDAALSPDAVYDFLYQFGIVAPIGEWLPPAGEAVRHINEVRTIPAGARRIFRYGSSAVANRVRKYKTFVVSPLNVTAEVSIDIRQTFKGSSFYVGGYIGAGGPCGDEDRGIFTTIENFQLEMNTCMELLVNNTDAFSTARIHIEGTTWEA